MDEVREQEVLKETLSLEDKKVAVLLFNHFTNIKSIKKDMVKALDLLDEVSENSDYAKKQLRKSILDNYNDLPRDALEFVEKINKLLKE
jgi:5'-deoxynucleotidase YfbR-like HD superfamily hydrolase